MRGEQATHYWDKLHALVAELHLDEIVRITGYLPADTASRYLAGADIGVLPFNCGITLKSGSLLTLLAHGLPVVATCHEPPDPDLADGIVRPIAPRDVDGLATALVELLSEPTTRIQLGNASRTFIRNFAWPAIATAHVEIYQTLIELAIAGG